MIGTPRASLRYAFLPGLLVLAVGSTSIAVPPPMLTANGRAQKTVAVGKQTETSDATALPATFIKASGFDFRDRAGKGKVVHFRGTNLGGWLCQEAWMCPSSMHFPPPLDNPIEDIIEREMLKRFDVPVKNALVDAFQSAWITDADLDSIGALGMNLIRVPITYCMFNEEDGTIRPDRDSFKYLDWVIREAGKRGIYTLIDLHRVQGGQTTPKNHDPESFWYNKTYKQRTDQIWSRIASRYRGEPMVIGYDLINEPWGTPLDAYDRLYKVIRAIDADHIIFMETWDIRRMPTPDKYLWTNVACSEHFYPSGKSAAQLDEIQKFESRINDFRKTATERGVACPLHIGEFKFADDPRVYEAALKTFGDLGAPWTFWTWKTVNQGGWGLYNRLNDSLRPHVPDLYKDSPSEIARKWSEWRTPEQPKLNAFTCDMMARHRIQR